MNCLFLERSS